MHTLKLSPHKAQSVWQQLQTTYLSQGTTYVLCICTTFQKRLHQSKECTSYLWPSCDCTTVQIPVKEKHENKLTTKFPLSFQNTVQSSFHFLHSSGRCQWLITCSNQTHSQLQFKPTCLVTWCIWEIKPTFPTGNNNSLRCQLTVSTPSFTVPSVPWRFLPPSLSRSAL